MLKPLTESRRYTEFVNARDRALEHILNVHLSALDILLGKTKRKVLALAFVHPRAVDREMSLLAYQSARIVERLRHKAYLLSHAGEAQAIHNVYGKSKKATPKKDHGELPSGGSVDDRVALVVSRLKRKIDDALQLSHVLAETHDEKVSRLERAFPPGRPRPKIGPRALSSARKMREAQRAKAAFDPSIYGDDEWTEILDDYRATELPPDIFQRGPEDRVVFFDADDQVEDVRYSWELEQETTEDFVQRVRGGAVDAARENGISDFLWNAVVDSKTDECCTVRDGKTSAEIEQALSQGPIDDDGCEAIVAPAHFNCRCKSVPMSDDIPEQAPPDFKEFDEWLEEKATNAA